MARALVTGGTGFLGTHLAAALGRAGYDVRVLDVHPPADPAPEQEFVHADVRDADAVRRAAQGCEVVIDNAALVPVTGSTPEQFRAVNVEGCRNTIAAAREQDAYLVHVSSTSIYGVPERLPVREDAQLRPFEPYGESKAEAERLVERERSEGFPIASLRSRAILGAGRLGLFELIFRRVRDGKRVPLFGRGEVRINMCDADDFCAATLAAIERQADGAYNVAAGDFGTVREDLQALIDHAGTSARLQPVPVWAIRAALRPLGWIGASPFTSWHSVAPAMSFYLDLSKARAELGWEPRHSNAAALAKTYDAWVSSSRTAFGGSAHHRPLKGRLARLLGGG